MQKKTKIDCQLITRGTTEVDKQVDEDLNILDPDAAIGKKIIEEKAEVQNGD